jgi:hypothetical protein
MNVRLLLACHFTVPAVAPGRFPCILASALVCLQGQQQQERQQERQQEPHSDAQGSQVTAAELNDELPAATTAAQAVANSSAASF